jgi:glycosyltransferase involved in cell wall biosynthesis
MSTATSASIISSYNYGPFLQERIDSVLNQTSQNVGVIVVDDGSTDNSREIIASYGDRIIPVLKANGGQGSAINAGVAVSQAEMISYLDANDICVIEVEDLQRDPPLREMGKRFGGEW